MAYKKTYKDPRTHHFGACDLRPGGEGCADGCRCIPYDDPLERAREHADGIPRCCKECDEYMTDNANGICDYCSGEDDND